jgi:hypothetical protein
MCSTNEPNIRRLTGANTASGSIAIDTRNGVSDMPGHATD